MTTIPAKISEILAQAFIKAGYDPSLAKVMPSGRPVIADYQCNAAMGLVKQLKIPAPQIAAEMIKHLDTDDFTTEIAGPGFINIKLSGDFLARHVGSKITKPESIPVLIDFGGPNVAKTMHVGHLRSLVIGDCLQRLFRYIGMQVTSDIHLGDWGLQMGMVIQEIFNRRDPTNTHDPLHLEDLTPDSLLEIYRTASVACKADPAAMNMARATTAALQSNDLAAYIVWEKIRDISCDDVKIILNRLGITPFTQWHGESSYHGLCEELTSEAVTQGIAQESDGALIIPLGDMTPLILRKSDGASLYSTTDLAALKMRSEHYKNILYVVDQRQALHFKQVFAAAQKFKSVSAEHIGFGTINGSDGKPFKTRDGDLVSLKSLIDDAIAMAYARVPLVIPEDERKEIARIVAISAIKYADLRNDRMTDYAFELEKFLSFEGKTGPYILYAAVRCQNILALAQNKPSMVKVTNEEERSLALELCRFHEAIQVAVAARKPHWLAEHAYNVANAFSRFYRDHKVIGSDMETERLALVECTLNQLKEICGIMGMEIPTRM